MELATQQHETVKAGHILGGERSLIEGHIQVRAGQEANTSAKDKGQTERRRPESTADKEGADNIQYPETPRRRRTHPNAPEFGGWDMSLGFRV